MELFVEELFELESLSTIHDVVHVVKSSYNLKSFGNA